MSATQITALITPVISAAVVAVLNYLHHRKTRKGLTNETVRNIGASG